MSVAYRLRLALAIAACVIVLVLTLMWRSVPAVLEPCPYDSEHPFLLGTCLRGPSTVELILKLTIALLAIATIAVLAARAAPKRKPIAGAIAAALSALVGLTTLQAISRQVFAVGYVPPVEAIGVVGGAFFLFGALVVWVIQKWRPNKRFE
jgi:hypothetical protein